MDKIFYDSVFDAFHDNGNVYEFEKKELDGAIGYELILKFVARFR